MIDQFPKIHRLEVAIINTFFFSFVYQSFFVSEELKMTVQSESMAKLFEKRWLGDSLVREVLCACVVF